MPLTNAERQKRWRQKQKDENKEEFLKRERLRKRSRYFLTSELRKMPISSPQQPNTGRKKQKDGDIKIVRKKNRPTPKSRKMPLSNAERQKRWREKQKAQNKEEFMEKERLRRRNKYIPTSELSLQELKSRRERIRNRAKKYYYKKRRPLRPTVENSRPPAKRLRKGEENGYLIVKLPNQQIRSHYPIQQQGEKPTRKNSQTELKMPISNAERQKRWREKQKAQNKEEFMEKERLRRRNKYIPTSELNSQELKTRRESNKNSAKKYYYKKKRTLPFTNSNGGSPAKKQKSNKSGFENGPLIVDLPNQQSGSQCSIEQPEVDRAMEENSQTDLEAINFVAFLDLNPIKTEPV